MFFAHWVRINLKSQRTGNLSKGVPLDGAVGIDFNEGVLVLRASHSVQIRVESLLERQCQSGLNASEDAELDAYAEMDDDLSFLNRVIRNLQELARREN